MLQQRLLVRPACGSDRAPKPLLPPLGVECLQRLLMVLSSRGPIAPWQKRPRKIKCSYACLRIRWHGSPCRPAVCEVVHQLSVEGLRVRGPRAGFRSCAASAPGAAALPAAHASVKRWLAPFGSGAEIAGTALLLPLRPFECICFPSLSEKCPYGKEKKQKKTPL